MTSIKTYTIIFVVLMAVSSIQAAVEELGFLDQAYWPVLGLIMLLSIIKATAVSGWYMHLKDEPRAITYIALAGLIGVIALTAGAAYSVT